MTGISVSCEGKLLFARVYLDAEPEQAKALTHFYLEAEGFHGEFACRAIHIGPVTEAMP